MPTIKIKCEGAATLDLDQLEPLQGALKPLSDTNYEKLKQSIVERGFSFPFIVWQQTARGKKRRYRIMDGHQRDIALKRMRDDGYTIPPLPVSYVKAKTEKEAREGILLISSQYGEWNASSINTFIEDFDIDIDDLAPILAIDKLVIPSTEEHRNNTPDSQGQGHKSMTLPLTAGQHADIMHAFDVAEQIGIADGDRNAECLHAIALQYVEDNGPG